MDWSVQITLESSRSTSLSNVSLESRLDVIERTSASSSAPPVLLRRVSPITIQSPSPILLRSTTTSTSTCSICLQKLGTCGLIIRCGHIFHEECLIRWFREGLFNCPVCRTSYIWSEVMDIMTTAQHHRLFIYEHLMETLIPSEGDSNRTPLPLDQKYAGCRCVVCRQPINDLFELFIPSGRCRHFFHFKCATDYFLNTECCESLNMERWIKNILIETNYCPDCIQTLDLNLSNRIDTIYRMNMCRNYHRFKN